MENVQENWHALSTGEIFKELDTSSDGLKNHEAQKRLIQYGQNELGTTKKKSIWLMFFSQFVNPLVYLLLMAALITYLLQRTLDTWVILGVVFLNAIFGFLHEIKAEKAMVVLTKLMALKAKVKRDKILVDLPSVEIVPGDIVEINAGGKIPADLRIIKQENLRVDEAILTGESVLQEKNESVLPTNTLLGDRLNMLFGGTIVISGRGLGAVVATGSNSEFGQIAQEVTQTAKVKTPLQQRLAKFSQILLWLVLGAVSIVFLIGLFRGFDLIEMFMISISITISVIPEGLPAIVTITLANGAFIMAKRKAIVRKLMAVETLGSISAIASDKTGTLTHNQMTVEKIYSFLDDKIFLFSGSGYEPKGVIKPGASQNLLNVLIAGVLCNDAEIFEENREWAATGDPTEAALVTVASKVGISKEKTDSQFVRLDEIPFETEKGFMATLNQCQEGKNLLVVKGKIEKIVEISNLDSPTKEKILTKMEDFANSALRVLAIATKELPRNIKEISQEDLTGLNFLGFFGMIDPPRKEAIEAIQKCLQSNVRPIMITGDYPSTAKAVANELGIIREGFDGVVSGSELEKLSQEEFDQIITKNSVFARISPGIKLRIVESLQRQGQIVAVTGDGINDAPALKKADIGIAMGEGGTDASREVADLVLADNNFATIIAAIEEGRTVFQNIRRAIFFLLSTNVGELFIIFLAVLLLPSPYNLPLIPVQILWLNLITDGTAGLALALEPTHQGVIKFPPRSPKEGIVDRITFWRIVLVSLVMLAGTMFLYQLEINAGADIVRARSVAFATMVVFQILNVLNSRSLKESIFKIPFFSNKYLIFSLIFSFVLSFMTIHNAFFQKLFHTTSLNIFDWLKILGVTLSIILIVELEKYFRRKTNAKY